MGTRLLPTTQPTTQEKNMETHRTTGQCARWVRNDDEQLVPCGADGVGVRGGKLPAGRRDVTVGPYCEAHGGLTQALRELHRDWAVVAPACVGDDAAVLLAGSSRLRTPDAVVVIRHLPGNVQQPTALVELTAEAHDAVRRALGRHLMGWTQRHRCIPASRVEAELEAVSRWTGIPRDEVSARVVHYPGHTSRSGWGVYVGLGTLCRQIGGLYESHAEAVEAGTAAWRAHLAASVAGITAARGGTMGWGCDVEPRDEPLIVDAAPGVCGWDSLPATPV